MSGTEKRSGRRTPRKRHAEVLDAAAGVFHRKGYEAASIQDIADEVGILKGSLY
nr:helix-turn-helix transcriptional regulator [Patulibacter sp.]